MVAARHGEIVALIETIRALDPQVASRFAQKAEVLDYDGLRRLKYQQLGGPSVAEPRARPQVG
jgi:hypothetical protein